MSRLNKAFSKKWESGDRPLVRGLPTDKIIDEIKAVIPSYLNALQTKTLTREVVREAYRYITGKGVSDLALKLLLRLLEEELQTTPRIRRGITNHD